MKRMMRVLVVGGLVLGLAACQTPVRPGGDGGESRAVDERLPAEAPSGVHYRVVTDASDVRVVIFPDGRLGHPHVFSGDALAGTVVIPEAGDSARDHHGVWLDLTLDVEALAVDDPEWRRDEGFEPEMSDRAREGTLANMRSEDVLFSEAHPAIGIRAVESVGPLWQPDLTVQVTLRGETRELTVPVAVHEADDGTLEVTGRFRILQTDFGIEPFSAVGGRVRVADAVMIRFRAVAEPVS